MQPLSVIHSLQKLTDSTACVFQIQIVRSVHLLLFERAHKALCVCVVVGIAASTHTDLNLHLLQYLGVFDRCVLHASIGVMNQLLGFPVPLAERHLQSSNRQFSLQASSQFPADNAP